MTLILSLATHGFVIQVSDRKVTYRNRSPDENRNKAVLFCNKMAFGYTGMGFLQGVDTDVWLWQQMQVQQPDFDSLFKHIADQAADAVEKANPEEYPKDRRYLAFVGVGYLTPTSDERRIRRPAIIRISNFHDKFGQRLQRPSEQFSLQHSIFKQENSWGWIEAGLPMTQPEISGLSRLLARACRKRCSEHSAIRLFIDAIYRIADRPDGSGRGVGKNTLITFIPRSAAESNSIVLSSADGRGAVFMGGDLPELAMAGPAMRFQYLPFGSNNPTQYAPHMVCPGAGMALKNIQMGPPPSSR